MIVERVKELENFANDFNNRLKTSENELETNSVYQKLNNRTIDNYGRNSSHILHSLSTSPNRNKTKFKPVIIKIY
jgi:hypothetical protein